MTKLSKAEICRMCQKRELPVLEVRKIQRSKIRGRTRAVTHGSMRLTYSVHRQPMPGFTKIAAPIVGPRNSQEWEREEKGHGIMSYPELALPRHKDHTDRRLCREPRATRYRRVRH
jgi:hypothetical protein